jgi:hypothetical protein
MGQFRNLEVPFGREHCHATLAGGTNVTLVECAQDEGKSKERKDDDDSTEFMSGKPPNRGAHRNQEAGLQESYAAATSIDERTRVPRRCGSNFEASVFCFCPGVDGRALNSL